MSYSAETSDSFSYCLNAAEKTTTHQIRAAALIITRVLCFRSPRKGGKQSRRCILLLIVAYSPAPVGVFSYSCIPLVRSGSRLFVFSRVFTSMILPGRSLKAIMISASLGTLA